MQRQILTGITLHGRVWIRLEFERWDKISTGENYAGRIGISDNKNNIIKDINRGKVDGILRNSG